MSLREPPNPGQLGRRAFLLGLVSCGLFYLLVHSPVLQHSLIHTYTTEHITEYAITGLFFWTNAELLLCFLAMRKQNAASRYAWLPRYRGQESVSSAQDLLNYLDSAPLKFQQTMIARRLDAALKYIVQRNSTEGFREYLDVLATRDGDEVFARYAFPRFVTTMLPILGLLGTVVHFGSALGGLSIDKLAEKVPEILSGMGTAFNTTCAALTASTSTMLIRFAVERSEEGVVLNINQYVEDNLLYRFRDEVSTSEPAELSSSTPLAVDSVAMEDLQGLLAAFARREQQFMELQVKQVAMLDRLLNDAEPAATIPFPKSRAA